MTLIELAVVVVILATVAAVVMFNVSSTATAAGHGVTQASMAAIRSAIVGGDAGGGFLADVRRPPARLGELFRVADTVTLFDPVTEIGWRGPYLRLTEHTYRTDAIRGFESFYGADGDPTVLDAFHSGYASGVGAPIVIQVPDPDNDGTYTEDDELCARLVSAGPNGTLDTPRNTATSRFPRRVECGDDIVLYLYVADQRL